MINIWNNHFYIKESKKQSWKVWNRAGELDIVEKLSKKLWDKYLNGPFSLLCRHFPHWVGEGPSLMWKMAHFTTSVGILGSSMRLTAFSSTPGLYYVTLPTGSVKVPHSSPATVQGPTFLPCHRSSWDLEDPKRVRFDGEMSPSHWL